MRTSGPVLVVVLLLTAAVFGVSAAEEAGTPGSVVAGAVSKAAGTGNSAEAAAKLELSTEHPERLAEQDCVAKPGQVVRPSKSDHSLGKNSRAMAESRQDRPERPDSAQGGACAG